MANETEAAAEGGAAAAGNELTEAEKEKLALEAHLAKRRALEEARRKREEELRCRWWTSWETLESRVEKGRWMLLSASKDLTCKLWDLTAKEDKMRVTLAGYHEKPVRAAAVAWEKGQAITGAADGTMVLWDLERCESKETFLTGKYGGILAINADFARGQGVTGTRDGNLCIWDVQRLACKSSIQAHSGARIGCLFTDFETGVCVSGAADGRLRIWDLEQEKCLGTYEGHESAISALLVDKERNRVLSADDSGALHYWHMKTRATIQQFAEHSDRVTKLDGNLSEQDLAASASNDESARIWDLQAGKCLAKLEGHKQGVSDIAADFPRQMAVTSSDDHTLKVWDLKKGRCSKTLRGHLDRVNTLCARFDRGKVLSGSNDCSMRLWDLQSMECEESFYGHADGVLSLL